MDLFSGLKSFFKVNASVIDNNVFRLHYKVTAVILVAFSILVTARQYIGDPIDCIPGDKIDGDLLDTYCWIHTTFSLPSAWEKKVGDEVPYPGIDTAVKGKNRVYHAYYQWVCFVLFLQAILFYIPRYFWKAMEGGRIKSLILGLNSPVLPQETKMKDRALLVEYMVSNLNNNNFYFMSFAFAEIMNFVNVVGQMFLMDAFFGGEFLKYGSKVLQFTEWDWSLRYDPMIKVFPRVTKCIFHQYGPSGDVKKHDTMCILPINIINEKIYLFLWFWFIILSVLSGLILLHRSLIIFWPKFRFMAIRSRARLANPDYLEVVVDKCQLGDWLILDLLSKNLDPLNFRDVIAEFARKLETKKMNFV